MKLGKKLVGYILSVVGLLVFLYGATPKLQEKLVIPLVNKLPMSTIITAGIIIALGGVGLLVWAAKARSEQPSEVPIYSGRGEERKIVGIQRIGK